MEEAFRAPRFRQKTKLCPLATGLHSATGFPPSMFPLSSSSLPQNAEALRDELEKTLGRAVQSKAPMIAVEDRNYPALAALRVSLDNAQMNDVIKRPPPVRGKVEPALQIEHLEINGQPFFVQRAAINLRGEARDVRIGQARDEKQNVVLVLQDAAEGSVEVRLTIADLEALILAIAKPEAAKQGISIEKVELRLQARSERALDLVAQVRAKKLFLTAAVKIGGSVEIDEAMNAHISKLHCDGEGNLGTLACGFLAPHLQRWEKRTFPLAAHSLGEIKLRDVRVAVGSDLRVTARFGRDV
jgi:hypothetical protein